MWRPAASFVKLEVIISRPLEFEFTIDPKEILRAKAGKREGDTAITVRSLQEGLVSRLPAEKIFDRRLRG